MSTENIDYQKARETLSNVFPHSVLGFVDTTQVTGEGNKILSSQLNLVIELLISNNRKLDHIIQTLGKDRPSSDFSDSLNNINRQIESLFVKERPKPIATSSKTLAVWTDPKTLFPKK